tara:strand:+ start:2360 stop:3424 length:1065 start_codon:yes stop_codon:yes gene_type:complete
MLDTNFKTLRHSSFSSKFIFLSPIIVILLFIVSIISLSNGAVSTSFQDIYNYVLSLLFNTTEIDPVKEKVISNIRFPRIILAILVGASLAVSGASLQGVFKNPMADPGIIGVSSGAALGAVFVLSVGLASFSLLMLPLFSFLGGLSAAFLVFIISRLASSSSSSSFILSGLAVSTFLNSVISLIILSSKKFGELTSILSWLAGGFQDSRWEHVYITFPIVLTALPFLIIYSNRINILSLSDDSAKSLGLNVNKDKLVILTIATLITSISVAVSGILAFVGIMIPHITRLIVGPDNRVVIPVSALVGSLFILTGDLLARTLFIPNEIRLGIITSFIGAPYFIFLLIKQRNTYIER